MASPRILIVDDEDSMRFFLSEAMKKEGYSFGTAASGEEALELLNEPGWGVALVDYNMPGMNGLETFRKVREKCRDIVVILMTAFSTRELAMNAIEEGVFDFFSKPFEISEMRMVIRRAVERWQLQAEILDLKSDLGEKAKAETILGNSQSILEINERIQKVSSSAVSVLILGESGTGKELIAHAIHANSSVKKGPFVKVNCAAVPHDLLEAEFFGHEKGAFTGAHKMKRGKFELAEGGTLFLDEIGDMPATTQMKILRALQEREIERLGGEESIKVDTRVIAATNKDLQSAVDQEEFRADLFYRLNVVSFQVPPLRERREDIPLLVQHFLELYNEKFGKQIKKISDKGMALLGDYSWPGNIRELENVIQRGMVLSYDDVLTDQNLLEVYPALGEKAKTEVRGKSAKLQDALDDLISVEEKKLIHEALVQEKWKRQETADRLGISRKSLHNKMKKYGLMN
ncbi:MAG: sigma-54-dependent Fis family transcriptional regulator [Candidatus Nitronauta litoralis]|uniref:Sigma-54-dependent Fis family transcriptional regulator n=1 Tax=Candidatus Nitronauta litoralis TaxID=2705533 RepID=A0A7T0FZC1_9BACT|nr:MAG: sigma-54-dependent Fis family transcriptional regulator [Candidatus Nitronauta litoralis]